MSADDNTVHDEVDPLDREYAPGWRPDEGEKVRGVVVDLDTATRPFEYGGDDYPVVTIKLADGFAATTKDGVVTDEVAIHVIHSSLAGKLAAIEPKVNDEIGVKFVGEPLGTARSKRYRVDKSRDGGGAPSASVDWRRWRFADDGAAKQAEAVSALHGAAGRVAEAPSEQFSSAADFDAGAAATEQALAAERDERDAGLSDMEPIRLED